MPDTPEPAGGRTSLRYVRGKGLSIADARELRVDVADDALRVHRPGRQVEIIGSAADLTSATWLSLDQTRKALGPPPPLQQLAALGRKITRPLPVGRLTDVIEKWHGGSVVIAGPDGPVLSFYVDTFNPWGGNPEQKHKASGAVGLARSLGLTLEPATDAALPNRRKARAALVEPRQNAPLTATLALALTLLAGVLAFLSMPYGETNTGLVLSLAALAVAAPVLIMLVRYRRRFEKLVTSPPPADGRTVYQPPPEAIGKLATHLQFGHNDVVLVDAGGREWWLPGPAQDGIATCRASIPQAVLSDADGAPMLVLQTDQIVSDPASRRRLEDAVKSAGIKVTGRPDVVDSSMPDLRYESVEPGATFTEWERGRINLMVTVLLPFAGGIHLMGAVILAGSIEPWGYLAPIGTLLWLGPRIWVGRRYRQWQKRIRAQAKLG